MKALTQLFAVLVLALCGAQAQAYTDCTSTIKWMHAEVGGNTYVYLASGSTFYIYTADSNSKALLSLAALSMTAQSPVTARFSASSLTCSTATGRTDLTTLYNYGAGI